MMQQHSRVKNPHRFTEVVAEITVAICCLSNTSYKFLIVLH